MFRTNQCPDKPASDVLQGRTQSLLEVGRTNQCSGQTSVPDKPVFGQSSARGCSLHKAISPLKLSGQSSVRTKQCPDKPVPEVSARCRYSELYSRSNQCSGQTSARGFSLHEAITPLKLAGQTSVRTKQCPDKAVPEVSPRCRYSELNSLPWSKPDKLVPDKGTKAVHGYQVPALCLQRQISL